MSIQLSDKYIAKVSRLSAECALPRNDPDWFGVAAYIHSSQHCCDVNPHPTIHYRIFACLGGKTVRLELGAEPKDHRIVACSRAVPSVARRSKPGVHKSGWERLLALVWLVQTMWRS